MMRLRFKPARSKSSAYSLCRPLCTTRRNQHFQIYTPLKNSLATRVCSQYNNAQSATKVVHTRDSFHSWWSKTSVLSRSEVFEKSKGGARAAAFQRQRGLGSPGKKERKPRLRQPRVGELEFD